MLRDAGEELVRQKREVWISDDAGGGVGSGPGSVLCHLFLTVSIDSALCHHFQTNGTDSVAWRVLVPLSSNTPAHSPQHWQVLAAVREAEGHGGTAQRILLAAKEDRDAAQAQAVSADTYTKGEAFSPPAKVDDDIYSTPVRGFRSPSNASNSGLEMEQAPKAAPSSDYYATDIDRIFKEALQRKMATQSQVNAMKSNIADGTFTAEHYHKMWSERLSGGGKVSQAKEQDETYTVGRFLGDGAFGVVFSATTPEGKKAVMKSPIAASHNHEVIHEGAVLAVMERCRSEWPDAIGRDNIPNLVAAPGLISPKTLSYEDGALSQTEAGKVRIAASKRTILAMTFGGQNLSDYQRLSVEAVKTTALHPTRYLLKARKIMYDVFKAVHFLADYGHFCHRDLKMFNVAVSPSFDAGSKEEPVGTLFDFGTCYPCEYIPENVFGTNAYHPPEADACVRRTPPEEAISELKEFYDSYLAKIYDKETKIALTYDKEPARCDLPYGASDLFGCGTMLTEMIYGIYEQIESGGNWTHLLFPMSEPDTKKLILSRIMESPDSISALREVMLERCEFPGHFGTVIDEALAIGAGDLILKCLQPDPNMRILVEDVLDHPFWTAAL